jgi:hypothetical protein
MILDKSQGNRILSLLEEERIGYQRILEDLEKEWGYLKKNDTDSLISLFQAKQDHLLRIQEIRRGVEQTFAELIKEWGEPNRPQTVFDLIAYLPAEQGKAMASYKKFRTGIRWEIEKLNERNKRFVQESLDFIGGLVSLLTGTQSEEPHYAQKGVKRPMPLPPSWVSRKV